MPSLLLPDTRLRSPTAVESKAGVQSFVKRIALNFPNPGSWVCQELDHVFYGADLSITAIGIVPDRDYETPLGPHRDWDKGRADRGAIKINSAGKREFEADVLHMMDIWAGGGPGPKA